MKEFQHMHFKAVDAMALNNQANNLIHFMARNFSFLHFFLKSHFLLFVLEFHAILS